MPIILNLETGTEVCSVALSKRRQIMALRESSEGKNHARLLAVFIREVLNDAGIEARELDAVAVGMGPGSYTGLRVGVSTAKGICYGADKPLIAINSLKALAQVAIERLRQDKVTLENPDETVLAPMIDARRMEVYTQLFDQNLCALGEVQAKVIDAESFADILKDRRLWIFGNGAEKCLDTLRNPRLEYDSVLPSATGMVKWSEEAFEKRDFVDTAYFEPFYLKDFLVIPSKKKVL